MKAVKENTAFRLRNFFRRLWDILTKTRIPETIIGDHFNSRLLAFLLIILFSGFLFVDVYKSLNVSGYKVPWMGYLILLSAYLINRFLSYRTAAIITSLMFPFVLISQLIINPSTNNIQSLVYLALGIILASILLKQLEFIIFSVVIEVILLIIPFTGIIPDNLANQLVTPAMICLFTIILSQVLRSQLKIIEKRRRQRIEKSEKRFRDLVESTSDWIWEIDPEGNYTYSSPQVKEILGYDPEEIIGKSFFDFMPEDETSQIRELFNSLVTARAPIRHLRTRNLDKNGREVILETSGMPIIDNLGNFTGYRGIDRDISEKDRIESRLKESERRYRLFISNFQGIAYERNLSSNTLTLFDGSVKNISGYPRDRFLNGTIFWKDLVHEPDKHLIKEAEEKLENSDDHISEIEYRIVHSDNTIRWIKDICTVVEDTPTNSRLIQGVLFDITDNKLYHEKMRQSEKIEAIGLLAGGVAHDFNNQLTGIIGYGDLLKIELTDSPRLKNYADAIIRSASHAADLTDKLLAFARKGRYQSVGIDIHEIINQVIDLLKHTINRNIEIKRKLKALNPMIKGDPSRIQNAILNIALNSRDALPEGGTMEFATESVSLDKDYCDKSPFEISPGNHIKISISDNGLGMDLKIQSHIFEPFFTTKEQGKGTGMGLPAVYGTVKNHKGAIQVHSEKNIGTTFTIYLPCLDQVQNIQSLSHPEDRKKNPYCCKILIVDDEPEVLAITYAILESAGHEVIQASNGDEATAIYKREWRNIDLIILDMVMPVKGGKETFHELKKINPDVKVLLSSGYSLNEDTQQLLDRGASGFLQKPFRLADLEKKITEIL
ncbi:MAG: PAS domain S-box protein [Spirochaetales bacterium]|nr:PAS domain S-box protein [Spirochaetales bacterium]